MSLRGAILALPDDRDTVSAVHEVVAYIAEHPREHLDAARVQRATGMAPLRVDPVLRALADAGVIDCDGDPGLHSWRFEPDPVLTLEVSRYLRTSPAASGRLHRGVDRFRERRGTGRY